MTVKTALLWLLFRVWCRELYLTWAPSWQTWPCWTLLCRTTLRWVICSQACSLLLGFMRKKFLSLCIFLEPTVHTVVDWAVRKQNKHQKTPEMVQRPAKAIAAYWNRQLWIEMVAASAECSRRQGNTLYGRAWSGPYEDTWWNASWGVGSEHGHCRWTWRDKTSQLSAWRVKNEQDEWIFQQVLLFSF